MTAHRVICISLVHNCLDPPALRILEEEYVKAPRDNMKYEQEAEDRRNIFLDGSGMM